MSERATVAARTADVLITGTVGGLPAKPFELVKKEGALLALEQPPAMHTPFARTFCSFLASVGKLFPVCLIDRNSDADSCCDLKTVSAICGGAVRLLAGSVG